MKDEALAHRLTNIQSYTENYEGEGRMRSYLKLAYIIAAAAFNIYNIEFQGSPLV